MSYCQDCGCRVGYLGCENCNEIQYIHQQYIDQDMEVPDSIMKEVLEDTNKQVASGRLKFYE